MTVLTKIPVDIERQVFDYVGTGAPGTILANAPAGATYRQIDGGVGSMLWQKTTAGWEAVQTSAWNQAAADLRYGQLAIANSWAGIQTLTVGGLAIQLTNGTQNTIYWAAAGVNTPTFTTRSVGTKLVLYPTITGTQVDFAIGISSNAMWFSLPDNSAAEFWRFYGATTQVASLSGTGALIISGTLTTVAGGIADVSLTSNVMLLNVTQQSTSRKDFWTANDTTTGYGSAALWIRETGGAGLGTNTGASFAPRLGFHWGGIVASQIAIETSGRISIINNPGTGYENFIAQTITAQHATGAALILNTTSGATSDNNQIFFQRGGVIKWRVGMNIGGAAVDTWSLYGNALAGDVISANISNGLVTFPYTLNVGSTTGVQLNQTVNGQLVVGEITSASAYQMIIGVDTATGIGRIQPIHQTVGYTQLNLNPLGGLVTIGAGGLTNSGRYNFASGPYIVDSTASYPALFGSTTAVGLALYWNALAKGYLYSDSGGVGLLDSAGNWRVQATTTGGSLYGAWTITGNTSIGGTLLLTGAVTFSSNLSVDGTIQQKKGTSTYYDTPTVTVSSSAAPGSSSGYPTGHIWLQVTAPI